MSSESLLDLVLKQTEFSRKSRLPSLFSDFSQLSLSNRDGYEANIRAWISALNQAQYEFTGPDSVCINATGALAEQLSSTQWGRPLALAAVEREACGRKEWIPLSAFLDAEESIYSVPTLFSKLSLGSALRWGFGKIYTAAPASSMSGTTYVILANLERLTTSIADLLNDSRGLYTDYITTPTMFQQQIERLTGKTLSRTDLTALLQFLARDKRVLSYTDTTIKFLHHGESGIDESDDAIAHLLATRASMARTTASLQRQENHLSTTLQEYVATGRKTRALGTLRSLKRVQRQIEASVERETQVSALVDEIDKGVAQAEVLHGMALGSQVLRQVLRRMGGLEAVEQVIDDVEEQTQKVEDVGVLLQGDAAPGGVDDEQQVEDEYEALLKDLSPQVTEPQTVEEAAVVRVDSVSVQLSEDERTAAAAAEEARVPVLAS